jgi:hypothetical protein
MSVWKNGYCVAVWIPPNQVRIIRQGQKKRDQGNWSLFSLEEYQSYFYFVISDKEIVILNLFSSPSTRSWSLVKILFISSAW